MSDKAIKVYVECTVLASGKYCGRHCPHCAGFGASINSSYDLCKLGGTERHCTTSAKTNWRALRHDECLAAERRARQERKEQGK